MHMDMIILYPIHISILNIVVFVNKSYPCKIKKDEKKKRNEKKEKRKKKLRTKVFMSNDM